MSPFNSPNCVPRGINHNHPHQLRPARFALLCSTHNRNAERSPGPLTLGRELEKPWEAGRDVCGSTGQSVGGEAAEPEAGDVEWADKKKPAATSQFLHSDSGAGPPSYRQGPADAGEHTVEAEEVDQVKDEDHYQVAHGDYFKEAVGAIVDRNGASHTDESNQQGDLWQIWRCWHTSAQASRREGANGKPAELSLRCAATIQVIPTLIGWGIEGTCRGCQSSHVS